jgi:hypothetical protein
MSTKADRERVRKYELREAATWRAAGWLAQEAWRQAIYIGPGKLITKPKDFFDAFDLIAVHTSRGAVGFVQVTESPFVQERSGRADRNAAHGEPAFDFYPIIGEQRPDDVSVDDWMHRDDESWADADLGTVIVSYADPKNPERRWWTRKVA